MVRQWQDMIYAGNRVASSLQNPMSAVAPRGSADPYPDFLGVARAYRVAAAWVAQAAQLPAALARLLADPDEPYYSTLSWSASTTSCRYPGRQELPGSLFRSRRCRQDRYLSVRSGAGNNRRLKNPSATALRPFGGERRTASAGPGVPHPLGSGRPSRHARRTRCARTAPTPTDLD